MKKEPTPEQIAEGERLWREATIADDYLFSQVALREEITEKMLTIILGEDVQLIENPHIQETIILDHDVRGIRLDVLAKATNKIYNIEMQATDNRNLFERERLYRGIMDINESFKGMNFVQLKESIIIFICTFDPIGRGKPAYIQQSYESDYIDYKSNGKLYYVSNNAKTIYLNATAYNKEKNLLIRNFLSYVMGEKVKGDEFINMLEYAVTEIKLNQKLQGDYVKLMLRDMDKQAKVIEETRKEEQAKAKEKEKQLQAKAKEKEKQIIKNLLPILPIDQICKVANVSQALVEEVLTEIKNQD